MKKNIFKDMYIIENCDRCKKAQRLENEYTLQRCVDCGATLLPANYKENVKVERIHPVNNVNNIDNIDGIIYDFQMYFDFKDSEKINKFLDDVYAPYHIVFCEVDNIDGNFDLENARLGVSWHAEESIDYNFTKEQIEIIKTHVTNYINQKKLGNIKEA